MPWKKLLLTIFIISSFIFYPLSLNLTLAQSPTIQLPKLPKSKVENTGTFRTYGLPSQIISETFKVVLPIAGFIAVIVIIISGIQFVTSGGNPEAAASARNRLTFAIIGFVIIILAFAILEIIDELFLGNSDVV